MSVQDDPELQALLETYPESVAYHEAVHQALFRVWSAKELDPAVQRFFRPLLDGQPPNEHRTIHTGTLYWLGRLYERMGMPELAVNAYRSADRLAPGFEDVVERLEALAQRGYPAARPPTPPAPEPIGPGSEVRRSRASAAFGQRWRSMPVDPELSRKVDDKIEQIGHEPLKAGSVVAERYRVDAPIGEGGYGVVYRVTDLMIDEPAALKLFRRTTDDPTGLLRFKREMRITRRLFHPAIVRTFEFGVWEGLHFITMELLEGEDLAVIIDRREPLDVNWLLRLARQAYEALHAAHRAGVVHRDIKPENLFVLTGGEEVKVMDFGLSAATQLSLGKTAPGLVVGTPAYVAPERLRRGADPTDPRLDVYAMGLVLYEAMTGRLPWRATEVTRIFEEILSREPLRPRAMRPDIPEDAERLVLDLIARDPDQRIPTGEEAARRIDEILGDRTLD